MSRWSPLLEDLPELASPLLSALRGAVPALIEAALQSPERSTRPLTAALAIKADPTAQLVVVGSGLHRGAHGARDALFLQLGGEVRFRTGKLPLAGDLVLDLATNAILRLRLTEPFAV